MANGFFQDSNADYSMSRLCQFLSVVGGLALATMSAIKGDHANAAIIFGSVMTGGTVYAMYNRGQEAKENMLSDAAPVTASLDVKA